MNTTDKICDALSLSGYPVKEQGTYGNGVNLPDTLLTYSIVDQEDVTHGDNVPHGMLTEFRVALYSKRPAIVQEADNTLRGLLIPKGFIRSGGRPLPYDSRTEHYGYMSVYKLYEEV